MAFQRPTRRQRWLKMALFGASGSGKTYSALKLFKHFGRIALIDTERDSSALYIDDPDLGVDFQSDNLTSYTVEDYENKIAEAIGFDCLIIDGVSQAWEGKGGLLERVEQIKRSKGYKDGMRAWNDVKPIENRLWAAILDAPMHTIVTMRAKTQYEITKDDAGKTSIEKLGLAPIQRADREYEFDVVGRMESDNTLVVTKTRCSALRGQVFHEPGYELASILKVWLGTGEAMTKPQTTAAIPDERKAVYAEITSRLKKYGLGASAVTEICKAHYSGKTREELTLAELGAVAKRLEASYGEPTPEQVSTAPTNGAVTSKPKSFGTLCDEVLELADHYNGIPEDELDAVALDKLGKPWRELNYQELEKFLDVLHMTYDTPWPFTKPIAVATTTASKDEDGW